VSLTSITSADTDDLLACVEGTRAARDELTSAFNDLLPLARAVSAACAYRQPTMPALPGMHTLFAQWQSTEAFLTSKA
jgi:hypothetical protein